MSVWRPAIKSVFYLIWLHVAVAAPLGGPAKALERINEETARRLAAEAYAWGLDFMDYDKQDRSFFVFAPLGGEYGTAPVTWLGVNPWTGDVWDLWRCRRLSSARLHKSLSAIRRRFRSEERRQYARLHALRPVCYGP